ncbi:hypothetical protein FRC02_009295 [Tulasnella sp. 418]|nr:hypothetical protein FRC02_009295 [Tulasnella sp. 418]
MIAPFYSSLADTHKTVTFARVDVDKVKDVAQKYKVTAMPTFILIKNGQKVDDLKGADPRSLEQMVKKWAPAATSSEEGSSGASSGDISLLEFIDTTQVNCLNENPEHTLKPIIANKVRNTTDAYLESDADEQLLLTLGFIQTVRIRSIVLYTKNPSQGPKEIKIVANKPSIGFEDVESAQEPEVAQVLEVPEDLVKDGRHIHLRFVRLQRVNSLHVSVVLCLGSLRIANTMFLISQIFVASNQGGEDETRIDAIDIYGQPVA